MPAPQQAVPEFPHRARVSTRWGDNDVYGHVNNAVYYQYFDSVINAYLIERGGLDIHAGDAVGFIVRSECDYLAPVAYPGELEVGLGVERLGNSSVTYRLGLFDPRAAQPCALARMVHVFVRRADSRPVSLPAPLREALGALVLPG
ncbi:MAG: acyl-CoA thioesterase [Betaproteobacteria bacterium]|nr:acyl-CoA thioesterase [Betaproteobacteria bacterium]